MAHEEYQNKLQRELQEAFQKIVHDDEDEDEIFNMKGGVVSRWVVGIEVALPDGEVVLYHNCSPNTPGWQILGILQYLVTVEQTRILDGYSGPE